MDIQQSPRSPDGRYWWDRATQQWLPVSGRDGVFSEPVSGRSWDDTELVFSAKIKAGKRERLMKKLLNPGLRLGERALFVTSCNQFKPPTSLLVVTDRRVLTADNSHVVADFPYDEPLKFESDAGRERFRVEGAGGREITFKMVPKDDHSTLLSALVWARDLFLHVAPEELLFDKKDATSGRSSIEPQQPMMATVGNKRNSDDWPRTQLLGAPLSRKASLAVRRQCRGDEPWLILVCNDGAALLAAFEDRLVLLNTQLRGSEPGSRDETAAGFAFVDVSGLSHRPDVLDGRLEIVGAPDRLGAVSADGRSALVAQGEGHGGPPVISNMLPLTVMEYHRYLPQIDEVRQRIMLAANVSKDSRSQPVAALRPPSLADDLVKLANLKNQGVLTEAEFGRAKAKLLETGE